MDFDTSAPAPETAQAAAPESSAPVETATEPAPETAAAAGGGGAPPPDGDRAAALFGYITDASGAALDGAAAAANPATANPAAQPAPEKPSEVAADAHDGEAKAEPDPKSPEGLKATAKKSVETVQRVAEEWKAAHPDDAEGQKRMDAMVKQQEDMSDMMGAAADAAKAGAKPGDMQKAMLGNLQDKIDAAKQSGAPAEEVNQLQALMKDTRREIDINRQSDAYAGASEEAKEKARDAAAEIFSAADGAGTNFEKFDKAMHGKSQEEIDLIKGAFNEHYKEHFKGRTIDDYLDKCDAMELTPAHKAQLIAESKGDLAGQVTAELQSVMLPGHVDREKTVEALEELRKLRESGEDGAAQAEAIQQTWTKAMGKEDFDQVLDKTLGGEALKVARAVMSDGKGEEAEAAIDAAKLHWATHQGLFNTTDDKKVSDIMERYAPDKKTPGDIKALEEAAQANGAGLQQLVVNDADKGSAQQKYLQAIVGDGEGNQDKLGVEAGRIQVEMEKSMKEAGKDGRDVTSMKMDDSKVLDDFAKIKDPDERQAVLDRMGGTYEKLLKARTGMSDEALAANMQELVQTGRLKPATMVALAIKEDDVDLVKRATMVKRKDDKGEEHEEQMSKEEIAEMNADYQKQFGRGLNDDLNNDFHGMHGKKLFDAGMALRGKAANAGEALDRMEEEWQFERGLGKDRSIDAFSHTGEVMDDNRRKAFELKSRLDENGQPQTEEDKKMLEELTGWNGLDSKNYSEAKKSMANTVATAFEGALAIGTMFIPGLNALGAAMLAGGGSLMGTGIKMGIEGSDAGLDEAWDGVKSALTAAGTAGIMNSEGMKEMLKAISATGSAALTSNEEMAKLLAKGIKEGGKEFFETMIHGVGKAMLDGKPVDPALFGESILGALKGSLGGLAEGVLDDKVLKGLDPKNFSERMMGNLLKKVPEMGLDKAVEAIKGEAEGKEEQEAADALKTALGLVKTAVAPEEHEEGEKHDGEHGHGEHEHGEHHEAGDAVKERLASTIVSDKQRKANQEAMDQWVRAAH